MDVLILLMFVGIVVVTLTLGFFVWTVKDGSLQHSDRLALLPLRDDPVSTSVDARAARSRHGS